MIAVTVIHERPSTEYDVLAQFYVEAKLRREAENAIVHDRTFEDIWDCEISAVRRFGEWLKFPK